jgi:hypothetical protein
MRRGAFATMTMLALTTNLAIAQADLNNAIIQSQNPTNPRSPALAPLPVTPAPVVVPRLTTPSVSPAARTRRDTTLDPIYWGSGVGTTVYSARRHPATHPRKPPKNQAEQASRQRDAGDSSKAAAAENDKLLDQKLKSICRGC